MGVGAGPSSKSCSRSTRGSSPAALALRSAEVQIGWHGDRSALVRTTSVSWRKCCSAELGSSVPRGDILLGHWARRNFERFNKIVDVPFGRLPVCDAGSEHGVVLVLSNRDPGVSGADKAVRNVVDRR